MIVPGEFVQAYNQIFPALEKLKAKSDLLLMGLANSVEGRVIQGRIKPIESVVLKADKDCLNKPFEQIDDLLAATVIVRNETFLPRVEAAVPEFFEVIDKVPRKTVRPESFIYDDLRFLLRLKPNPVDVDPELRQMKFELQIKTEMQAAASSATRELDYKTQWLSWNRTRWAGRLRALVEMVDDLLVRLAEEFGAGEPPKETYGMYAERNRIIQILLQSLDPGQIPGDRRRLAIIVESFLKECKPSVSSEELGRLLTKEEYASIRLAQSLSVTQKVFLVLFREEKLLERKGDPSSLLGKRPYLITREMVDFCPVLKEVPENRRVDLSLSR